MESRVAVAAILGDEVGYPVPAIDREWVRAGVDTSVYARDSCLLLTMAWWLCSRMAVCTPSRVDSGSQWMTKRASRLVIDPHMWRCGGVAVWLRQQWED